jgi:hypothetical protein
MKVNSLDGKIVKLPYINIRPDNILNNLTDDNTITTTYSTAIFIFSNYQYNIFPKFILTPIIPTEPVDIKAIYISIIKNIDELGVFNGKFVTNSSITEPTSYIFQLSVSFSGSSAILQAYILKIIVYTSNQAVIISNVNVDLFQIAHI